MKIELTPTLQTIDLGGWNPAAQGQLIYVWVDPRRDLLRERSAYSQEYASFLAGLRIPPPDEPIEETKKETKQEKALRLEQERLELAGRQERLDEFLKTWNVRVYAWYAELWSQGPQGTTWTVEELAELDQTNPKLLAWLIGRSKELLDEYRGAEKKG